MTIPKIVIGCVFLVVIALSTKLFLANSIIEERIEEVVNEIDKHPMVTVVDKSYTSGLMGGTAITKLHLKDTLEENVVILKHEVSTAPVFSLSNGDSATGVAYIRTTVMLDDAKDKEQMLKMFAGSEPSVDTVLTFANNYKIYVNIPEVDITEEVEFADPAGTELKKQVAVNFSGLMGEFEVSGDAEEFSGIVKMPAFALKETYVDAAQNKEFKLNDMSSQFNGTRITNYLYSGVGDMKIGLIDISNSMMPLTLTNNVLSYQLLDKKDTVDFEFDLAVDKIGSSAGMPLPVNKIKSKFALRNLDTKAMAQYNETIQQLSNQGGAQDMNALIQELTKVGDQLLKRNLKIEEALEIGTEQGPGNMTIKVDFEALVAEISLNAMDPTSELLPRTSVDIQVDVPKLLIDMTPFAPQVAQFIKVGYIKEDANNYSSHALFKKMKLTVNGQQVDVPLPGAQSGTGNSPVAP